MALKFYTSLAKELKLKVRKLLRLILKFVEVTGEKLVCVCVCMYVCTSIHREGFICLDQLEYQGTDQRCCLEDVC